MRDPRRRSRGTLHAVALLVAALAGGSLTGAASAATYFTPTQQELLAVQDITELFGGNGSILSATADGDGVVFEIAGGTVDFGKVAARVLGPRDLSGFDGYALQVEIVLAPYPVEVNPFIQTGSSGQLFVQDIPGVKQQGDTFVSIVPFAGVANIDHVYGFGFQYFTAGDIEMPLAQNVTLRITPIPEPSTAALAGVGTCALALLRRRGCSSPSASPPPRAGTGRS
jgi:hypothetical protein